MDSTTSHHHDESDDERDELDRINARELLDHLAAAPADDRVRGTALLLTGTARPPRAFLGNPPRSAQKKLDQARSGPERAEKR